MNFMLIKDFIPNSHNLLNLKNKILRDEETRNFITNPKNFKYFFYKNFEDAKFKGIDGFEFLDKILKGIKDSYCKCKILYTKNEKLLGCFCFKEGHTSYADKAILGLFLFPFKEKNEEMEEAFTELLKILVKDYKEIRWACYEGSYFEDLNIRVLKGFGGNVIKDEDFLEFRIISL